MRAAYLSILVVVILLVPLGLRSLGAEEGDSYLLDEGDVLKLTVLGLSELSQDEIPILPGGLVTLPFVGTVDAKGKTVEELEAMLYKELSEFLLSPRITLIVIRPREDVVRVQILGMVEDPGYYKINRRDKPTILTAIAMANGFRRRSNPRSVVVISRDGLFRTLSIRKFLNEGGESGEDIALNDGDIVFVREVSRPELGQFNLVNFVSSGITAFLLSGRL